MTGPALLLEGVGYSYGRQRAVEGVSLAVGPGEMLAVIGRNGAGKSTLLRLACGILRPHEGHIAVEGRPLSSLPARARARMVALVEQSPQAPFSYTVREWVALGRTPYLGPLGRESPADHAAVARALDVTDLAGRAGHYLGDLSGGERQRAHLAQSLAQEPRVLLLDEATAQLDLAHQTRLLELVRSLAERESLAVMAALHDLSLASLWFDNLALVEAGRLLSCGPPAAILNREDLEAVYGCRLLVQSHPVSGRPLVHPAGPGHGAGS